MGNKALEERVRCDVFEVEGRRVALVEVPIAPSWWPPELSEAERDIALSILRGDSNADISARRSTSLQTVTNQLNAMYQKLGVSGRTAFIAALFESASTD